MIVREKEPGDWPGLGIFLVTTEWNRVERIKIINGMFMFFEFCFEDFFFASITILE